MSLNSNGRILILVLVLTLMVAAMSVVFGITNKSSSRPPSTESSQLDPAAVSPESSEASPNRAVSPEGAQWVNPPIQTPVRPPVYAASTPASIAASPGYVYVVRGNTLYQYSERNLRLLSYTDLPSTSRGSQRYYPNENER